MSCAMKATGLLYNQRSRFASTRTSMTRIRNAMRGARDRDAANNYIDIHRHIDNQQG